MARNKSYFFQWYPWWRHQRRTFSEWLALCTGNLLVTGEFPSQNPVTRNFDVFFDMRLNQQWSKQWRHRWFEMLTLSLSIDSKYIASRIHVEGSFIAPTQRQYDPMKPMTARLRPRTVRGFRVLSPIQTSNGLFARNYMGQYPPWIMYAVLTGFVSLWLYSNFWINSSGRLPLFMKVASLALIP